MKDTLRLVSNIDGLHCLSCISRITSKLTSIGAVKVDIDIPSKIMKVDYEGNEEDALGYIDAVKELGYKANKIVVFDPEELNNL